MYIHNTKESSSDGEKKKTVTFSIKIRTPEAVREDQPKIP